MGPERDHRFCSCYNSLCHGDGCSFKTLRGCPAPVSAHLGQCGGLCGLCWCCVGNGDFMKILKKTCDGSIGECLPEEEMIMDLEMNKKILATTQYISYGVLRAYSVPCSKTRMSYYDCGSSGQANPYNKSCT